MNFKAWRITFFILTVFGASILQSPAPFIYTPGEGWTYENPGDEKGWKADRAQDQLEITKLAVEAKDGKLALRSAKRILAEWPLSDFASEAQFYAGEAYILRKMDEKAFDEFQLLIDLYPKSPRYDEALNRQFEIATRFLDGQRTRILWGKVPFFKSMGIAIEMNEKVISNGPYTDTAAQAQLNIGLANERKKSLFMLSFSEKYTDAAAAYEQAAFKYFDRPDISSDALFRAGNAYFKQARTGEYDQGFSEKAILSYQDFIAMFPDDERVPEANENIATLKREQSRGSYLIARFYEKRKKYVASLIYFNDSIAKDPTSEFAELSRKKISQLQPKADAETQSNKSN